MSAELTFPVERGSVMAFARSIGDPNPIYFDEEYAASSAMALLIAPPTFVQSSAHFDDNYPLRPKIGAPWFGATRGETTELSTELGLGLHAEQHYDYQRAIRAGEVLRVRERVGAWWARDGRRGGRLRFSETVTEYFDGTDQLVVTVRTGVDYSSSSIDAE